MQTITHPISQEVLALNPGAATGNFSTPYPEIDLPLISATGGYPYSHYARFDAGNGFVIQWGRNGDGPWSWTAMFGDAPLRGVGEFGVGMFSTLAEARAACVPGADSFQDAYDGGAIEEGVQLSDLRDQQERESAVLTALANAPLCPRCRRPSHAPLLHSNVDGLVCPECYDSVADNDTL